MTLLEAMAASLPVVVTAVGAIPSVVEDGVSGRVIPPLDQAALEKALVEARDPARAASWGRAARMRIEQHFNVEVVLKNYEELYAAMLSR